MHPSMDFQELYHALLETDETDRIEAKKAQGGLGKSFLQTVSAFSNEPDLGGGYILLGISENPTEDEPKYLITGVQDPDKLQRDIVHQCRHCFNLAIQPTLKVISHLQGTVILVHIPEAQGHEKPVYVQTEGIEGGTYRRIGPSDLLCTRDDLDLLYQLRSKKRYEETTVESATLNDFYPLALKEFRHQREKIKPGAAELRYNDGDLLQALEAVVVDKGATHPTIAGLLLFGTPAILQRILPIRNSVDYMLVEGREWVSDPDRRFTALEICEPLLLSIPKILNQVMNDLPQIFELEEDGLQRKDNPLIPRKVIREGLVNALMHRDYRAPGSTQIIKYSNRIEFRNPGYSLKPKEQLGLPGSMPRNEIISRVLREIHYAEAKGSGISTMCEEMQKANLSLPFFESNRLGNFFVLTLLPHHLFSKSDIDWLRSFAHCNLADEEARTLIVTREKGAITNAEHRALNAIDTLTASAQLRKLRDLGLLDQKGKGNATYYVPTEKLLSGKKTTTQPKAFSDAATPQTTSLSEGLASPTSSLSGKLASPTSSLSGKLAPRISELFDALPKELKEAVEKVNRRTSPQVVRDVIRQLCAFKSLQAHEMRALLRRSAKHFSDYYLSPMVESGELELVYPERITHPEQAYRTKASGRDVDT